MGDDLQDSLALLEEMGVTLADAGLPDRPAAVRSHRHRRVLDGAQAQQAGREMDRACADAVSLRCMGNSCRFMSSAQPCADSRGGTGESPRRTSTRRRQPDQSAMMWSTASLMRSSERSVRPPLGGMTPAVPVKPFQRMLVERRLALGDARCPGGSVARSWARRPDRPHGRPCTRLRTLPCRW